MLTIEELIKIEQNKLNDMIAENGEDLSCSGIMKQSEKIDKLINLYFMRKIEDEYMIL